MDKKNISIFVNQANQLFLEGKTDEALEKYRYALSLKPDDLIIKENLSLALISKGEFGEAEILIKEILAKNSNHSSAYNLLGNIYFYKSDFQRAKEYYEKAVELDSNSGDAWSNLGNVFFETAQMGKAEECYRRSVEINPKNPFWHGNLGKVLFGQDRLEPAVESYKKAVMINPALDDFRKILCGIYSILGNKLQKKGDMEGAGKFYKEALELDNKNVRVYNRLVGIRLLLNDYTGAYSLYETCSRNCPSADLTKYPNLARFVKH